MQGGEAQDREQDRALAGLERRLLRVEQLLAHSFLAGALAGCDEPEWPESEERAAARELEAREAERRAEVLEGIKRRARPVSKLAPYEKT